LRILIFFIILVLFISLSSEENIIHNSVVEFNDQNFEINLPGITKSASGNFFDEPSIIVWGTLSDDEDELEINRMFAEDIVDFRITRWLIKPDNVKKIIPDSLVKSEDLEEYNLILVGTVNSNTWLKLLEPFLPFQINSTEINFKNYNFTGDEVGINFRYPNPFNPQKQLWIITAPSYEALRFIPKKDDYCIYELTDYSLQADRFNELAQGDFDENWELDDLQMIDNIEIYSGENDSFELLPIKHYPAPEWCRSGVMYEIFVRSFADSDGDGIGDLKGLTAKLDYLNDGDPETDSDLGIELIWLMPIFESPSYHCYDVADYYKIESDYGTNADFQELLREAHKRGIRIITDLVLNHCSSEHEFFQDAYGNPDSEFSEWFYFTNAAQTRAHNWQFRHRAKDRSMLEPYMPAWNVNNPEVQNYLFEMAKYWMDPDNDGDFSDGIDGFRCDYVKGPPHEFWKNFRQEVKALNPEVLLLAENWDGMVSISQSFDDEFDMAFDFPFQGSLVGTISSATSNAIISVIEEQQRILPEHAIMNRFFNNHDMNRIFTTMDDKSAKQGLTILLAMNNMPMLYYGDEIGMKGEKDPYDEGIRRPMEWCRDNSCLEMTSWYPVWNDFPDGISVEEQIEDSGSILNYIKRLIRLREDYPVLETGEVEFLPVQIAAEPEEQYKRALVYCLKNERDIILIAANLHKEQKLMIDLSELGLIDEIRDLSIDKFNYDLIDQILELDSPEKSTFIAKILLKKI
jgi:alpha-amylase